MKKLIAHRIKALAFLALLLFCSVANAQVGNFNLSVQNLTQTAPNKLEFDVYLLDTDPVQTFELASCQLGFLFNSLIYAGGTVSVAINNTGSGLNAAQLFTAIPNVVSTLTGYPNQSLIRLAAPSPVSPGGGTIISTVAPGTLLTHFTLTSTVSFAINSTPNLIFTSSTASPPLYATRVSEFIASVSTPLPVAPGTNAIVNGNPALNPSACANPPTVTLSSSSGNTCGTTPVTVSGNTFGGNATSVTIAENGAGTVNPAASGTSPFAFTYTPAAGDAGNTVTITVTTNNPLGAPCVAATANYILTVNAIPSAPSVGIITHPTCALSTGSVVLNSLPAGNWTINPGSITGSTSSTTISGLIAGTYFYTVTSAAGCTSAASSDIVINTQPATPPAPTVTLTQPTCAVSTGTINITAPTGAGMTYSINGSTYTNTTGIFTLVSPGPYTVFAKSAAGCISPVTNVTITAQPATPAAPAVGTITHPTCTVATGSVVLNGLPAGNWTINPGAIAGTGSSRTISGLAAGTYNYTVTNAAGCTSPASANVVINAQPATPSAPAVGTITHPTCTVATGSVVLNGLPAGNWTINPGAIAGTGLSRTISGLAAGTYNYTVTNAAGCTSPASANVVINAQPATPSAPAVGTITHPTCTVATGSVVLNGLPAGNWTINPGAVASTGSSTTISGLAAGTYNYTVTNAAGCTSPASASVVINAQPASPASPTQTVDCSLGFGNAVVTVTSPLGPGLEYRLDAGSYQSGTSFTNVANENYTITVRNSSGCTTTGASFPVTCGCVNGPTVSLSSINGSTCGTTPVTVSGNTFGGSATNVTITENGAGTVNPAASGTSPFAFTYTPAAGDAGNTVTITVTTNNPLGAPCVATTATYTLTVNANPSAPGVGVITQPTCSVPTGSVVLNGLPASGTWTLTRTPGGVTTGSGPSTIISGLAADTYTFTVTNANNCISGSSSTVVINAQPATPPAPLVGTVTPPTCTVSTGSVLLSGLPSIGSWTLTRTPGGVTTTGSGTSAIISNLSEGTYTYTVTNSVGCISPSSGNVVIPAQPAIPSAPAVGVITHPTCSVSTGSVVLNGLPATGIWTLTRLPGTIISTGTGTSTTITGLSAGTYNYTVANAAGCLSGFSTNVVISAQPATPTAPTVGAITQPTCALATGSVVLNGLPAGNWTINPGARAGTGSSTSISGLAAGTYNYTVTNAAGCTSPASADVVINAQPATPTAPTVGTITQPTCALSTGSVILGGLPAGNWIINPGAIAGTGSSTTISGLAAGTYNYSVTNAAGCISPASASVVINAQPASPASPTQTVDCSLGFGNAVVTVTSPLGAGLEYRLGVGSYQSGTSFTNVANENYTITVRNSSGCTTTGASFPVTCGCVNGPTVSLSSINGSTCGTTPVTVSGNTFGGSATNVTITENGAGTVNPAASGTSPFAFTYTPAAGDAGNTVTITVTTNNPLGAPCVAATATYTLTVNANPSAPGVGVITQPTCSVPTGSVVLNGLPASGTWTLTRTPGGVTTGSGPTTIISGLAVDTYTFTVTNANNCISGSSSTVVINAQPATPPAPLVGTVTPPTCTVSTGSVLLSGLPSIGSWTLTRTPGGVTTTGSGTSAIISNLSEGTYTYTVTNSVGCISPSSGNVVIPAQPAIPSAPVVGVITPPTCSVSTGSVVLNGLPATGIWTLTRLPGTIISTGTGTSTTITGLSAGTYNYTVANAAGCLSGFSANVEISAQPATPSAPAVGTIAHPTCTVATGSVVLNGLPAGNWTINPGALSGTGASTTISGLAAGTYNFTVTNSAGCTSAESSDVVINAQPAAPSAPVVGTIIHPTCTIASGSVVLSGLPSSGTWTLTRNPGGSTTTGTGTSTTISGLAAGTYTYTVINSAGCTSSASTNVVINAQPASPASPAQTVDCTLGYGQAVVTVTSPLGAGLEYRLDGGSYQSGTSFTNVANGSHTITVRNSLGCTTTGVSFSVSCGCANPPALALTSISGSTCGTTPVTVSGNTFGGSATSVTITENGAGTVSPGTTGTQPFAFTYTPAAGDAGNTVIITVTTDNPFGVPCAAATATYTLTVNANPSAPGVGAITQPTCSVATGSVVLNGLPATGTWTLTRTPGGVTTGSGTSTNISGLAAGTYTYTVTSAAGCISVPTANVVINAQPITPAAPGVGAITQPTCSVGTGSVVLNGLPSGSWTINPGGITGSGTSTQVSNLATGTYTFTVTNFVGCTSEASANVVINAQLNSPQAPTVGTITPPTCTLSTGSVQLNGLPATGTWMLIRYPGTVSATGTGISTTISGLSAGIYNYTVTNEAGCLSAPSGNVVIPEQPVTPAAPGVGTIIQPTCTVGTGSVVMSGLPASGTWTLIRTPGGVITTGTGTNITVSGLATGTYNYTVTNSVGCTSEASVNVIISAQPATPAVIITNPAAVCSPLKVDLTAESVTSGSTPGLTFTYWTNAAATVSYTTPTSAGAGTYYIKGTTTSGCFDVKPVTVTVNPLPAANAGTGGNECDLNFTFNAVPSIGVGTWTKVTGPGTTTFAPNANTATAVVTVSQYGTYTFTWTEVSGACSNSSIITVDFYQQPVANAGTAVNNCGLDIYLNGSLNIGTGTWSKVSGPGNVTFGPNANTAKALVTVTAYGSYVFRWTVVNGTCSNSATVTITFIQQPPAEAGAGGDECDKDFILNAGTTTGTGTWTKISGPGNAVFTPDDHQTNAKVTVSQVGTYDFAWTVVNSTCTSSDVVRVVFHELPALNAGNDTIICKGDSIQLGAQGTGSFVWIPDALIRYPDIKEPYATPVTTTTFTVTLTDQFGCKKSDDVIVEVREKPVAYAGPDQVLEYLFGTNMKAELAHNYETGVWSKISGTGEFFDITYSKTSISKLSLDKNKFLWTVTNRVCPASSDTVMIMVHDLVLPTLITPNMDGKNDYFVVGGSDNPGKMELVIFDRRGVQVYKNLNYDNSWNGVDYNGNPLPDDTYFLVLKTEDGKSRNGFIIIRR